MLFILVTMVSLRSHSAKLNITLGCGISMGNNEALSQKKVNIIMQTKYINEHNREIQMRQPNFTWFTPTLGLRPPKIVQTKPSRFCIFIKESNKVTKCIAWLPCFLFLCSWAPSLGVKAKFSTSKNRGTCGSTANNHSQANDLSFPICL